MAAQLSASSYSVMTRQLSVPNHSVMAVLDTAPHAIPYPPATVMNPQNAPPITPCKVDAPEMTDEHWLANFESLGSNCEFGFVLKLCGIDNLSLFRWAEVFSIRTVTRIISNDFAGLFEFDHLRPYNAATVRDSKYNICWHTALRSTGVAPDHPGASDNFAFVATSDERKPLWEAEHRRLQFLARVTAQNIERSRKIFIYKSRQEEVIEQAEMFDLFRALNKTSPNKLLIVSEATDTTPAGSFVKRAPGLLHGRVDRFAPGDHADHVSLLSWLHLCRAVLQEMNHAP